jgi:hypothetical protein
MGNGVCFLALCCTVGLGRRGENFGTLGLRHYGDYGLETDGYGGLGWFEQNHNEIVIQNSGIRKQTDHGKN